MISESRRGEQPLQLFLGEFAHVRIAAGRHQFLRLLDVVHDRLVLAIALDRRLDVR